MSNKLPVLKGDEIVRVLIKLGFRPNRKRGSHLILEKNGKMTVVPIHEGRDISKGTLLAILKQAGISKQELKKYL
ncbi:type II toxin-antitoxin system HicA family toxin [Candidatus Wolfebacteria bacterium]|nr:type II toxin-antitoxin system HicA family toxin [Candidatus Wolfebacteria bacterium]